MKLLPKRLYCVKNRCAYLLSLLYVPFIAIFPLLHFYAHNADELTYGIIQPLLSLSLVISIAGLGIFSTIFQSGRKSAVFIALLLTLFFSYGRISSNLSNLIFIKINESFVIGPDKILIPLTIVIITIVFVWLLRTRSQLSSLSSFLTLLTLILVFGNVFSLIINSRESLSYQFKGTSIKNSEAVSNLPDIYYIILDGYARSDILDSLYNYSNYEFDKFLDDKGFFIANNSHSNYAHTIFSLASTLNVEYLTKQTGGNNLNRQFFEKMISKSNLVDFLKFNDYTILNFNSGWNPTGDAFVADKNLNAVNSDEFDMVFLRTTLAGPFLSSTIENEYRYRTLYIFSKLEDIPYIRGKKFTLAHITAPHPPYVFDESGKPTKDTKLEMTGEVFKDKERYLEQLLFVNQKTKSLLEELIKRTDGNAIIILQSDHGPASILGSPDTWERPYDENGVIERMSILNAYYFPDGDYSTLYPSITPINTFRVILNKYFKQDIELQPDKSFISDEINPYDFLEISSWK